jgi:hypothetical protein
MALYRKSLMITYCRDCGSWGIPMDEQVYDPSSGKQLYVCRNCFTVQREIDTTMVQVVDGKEWGEKHPVRDHKLNVPFDGGKK